MQNTRLIDTDLVYVGASDRKLALFENVYPIPRGVSYNSYLLLDEKTVLFDTTDAAVASQFFDNVAYALNGRKLDYLVVHHLEPDHAALIEDIVLRYPEVTIVTNALAANMIHQFFSFNLNERLQTVAEGGTLCTGRHTLHFVMAPMVHWPEVMVSYDDFSKTLFSADAFGTFGALNGHIFADEVNFERDWLDDARRYLVGIVGKYGVQVQATLKKAASLDIARICPLHGPIWRKDLGYYIGKYDAWSRYDAECKGVMIVFGSVYGNTAAAAERLATLLSERGVKEIALYDASHTDVSYLLADAFRYSHLVVAAATYNAGIFTPVENFINDLALHNYQNRKVALIENGSWAPMAAKQMRARFEAMKNITLFDQQVVIKSSLKPDQAQQLEAMADAIATSLQ